MVRVGEMGYSCKLAASMGSRINDMTMLSTEDPIDRAKSYVVAGWGLVNEDVEGPAIFDLMESYVGKKKVINMQPNQSVKVV